MEELKITTAAANAEHIQNLLEDFDAYLSELFPPEAEYGLAVDELRSPNVRFVFVEQGDAVIGCGALRLADDFAEIKRMYVVPDARRRGHARRLLAALEDAARELGYERVRLDTGARQPHARALYEAAGFQPIPDYNDNPKAAYWGEKVL